MKRAFTGIILLLLFSFTVVQAQLKWVNVDADFAPLPANVHVYKTTDSLDGKPNIAFYVEAKLKDKHLNFTTDTTYKRRLTPKQFFEKNNHPLLVVNTTFFSFATNQNLNVVIKDGKLLGYNIHSIPMKGKDTFQYRHPLGSAIGIDKKRNADVAWVYTDSSQKNTYAVQKAYAAFKDSINKFSLENAMQNTVAIFGDYSGEHKKYISQLNKWKMKTAVGGGPVLVQAGKIKITNNEELKFGGKAIEDKHPRTCIGYTGDGKLIIMVIQGRFPGIAE
jgi:Phosphodiester glycosidase